MEVQLQEKSGSHTALDSNGQHWTELDSTDLLCMFFEMQMGKSCPGQYGYQIFPLQINGDQASFNSLSIMEIISIINTMASELKPSAYVQKVHFYDRQNN